MENEEYNKNYLILLNNVKDPSNIWPNEISKAFMRAKTRFGAGSSATASIKIIDTPESRNTNINNIINYIKNTYNTIIFAVFDKQSLKNGSVAVYYLDDDNEYKDTLRCDPGMVSNIYDNLYIANMDWEEFKDSANSSKNKIYKDDGYWDMIKEFIENIK